MNDKEMRILDFVNKKNSDKLLFTPGPAALLSENLLGLAPCFGRGDSHYIDLELDVMNQLKAISRHSNLIRLQGSATLAIEVAINSFVKGRVLVVNSGYYSQRLELLCQQSMNLNKNIQLVDTVNFLSLDSVSGCYDWVVACYVETSQGLRLPVDDLKALSLRLGSQLFLDSTASIGLEDKHHLADCIAYSSCKGLLGLRVLALLLPMKSQYSRVYLSQQTTLPTQTRKLRARIMQYVLYIMSAESPLTKRVRIFQQRVFLEKFAKYVDLDSSSQPWLCTVECQLH